MKSVIVLHLHHQREQLEEFPGLPNANVTIQERNQKKTARKFHALLSALEMTQEKYRRDLQDKKVHPVTKNRHETIPILLGMIEIFHVVRTTHHHHQEEIDQDPMKKIHAERVPNQDRDMIVEMLRNVVIFHQT